MNCAALVGRRWGVKRDWLDILEHCLHMAWLGSWWYRKKSAVANDLLISSDPLLGIDVATV